MPDNISFNKTFQALEAAIRIAQKRHGVIASNISNIDTPGYRAKDIDFKETLERALQGDKGSHLTRTDPKHIGSQKNTSLSFQVYEENDRWNGFNSVDIDREMSRLTQNNLIYRTAVESLLRKITILREVIKEGGR